MEYPALAARVSAASLFLSSLLVLNVASASAAGSVFGTIQVSGPAWVASDSTDWSKLSSTRPLVAGDRLRTGSDGYLLADLGEAGVVGLYGDAEVAATDTGRPVINVQKGKVAFHLSPKSTVMLQAKGASIASDAAPADGYVEYGADGVPTVVVEEGGLNIQMAGVDHKLERGDKLALDSTMDAGPTRLAASDGSGDETKKAAAYSTDTGKHRYGGLTPAGWTAIGTVIVAAGTATAVAVSSDNQNSDDNNGSD
jgi:hypothetical protein